ncbi:MAG: phosphotransferase enzyme family protein [Bacilli bacterium]
MENCIVQKFNEDIMRHGAALFGVTPESLSPCHGSMNFVYEYENQGTAYILRFTPSSHHSFDMVRGELEWLLYLKEREVSVSAPVASVRGTLAELVGEHGSVFTVTSFVKACGKPIAYPDCLHDHELYYKCGVAIGRLHAVSKSFVPSSTAVSRQDWRNNFYLTHIREFIPRDQAKVFKGYTDTMSKLMALPVDRQSFGLTHGDVHVGNLRVDGSRVTLFDFDEAQYSWFMDDIVTQMYYLVYVYGGDDGRELRESQAKRFMANFMKGYFEESSIDDYWMSQVPLFLRLREIIVYVGMYKNHPDVSELNQWGKDYMSEAKVRIEGGIPIVDMWGLSSEEVVEMKL